MSRELIDGALSIAQSIRDKKNMLVKANLELFEEIRQLDDMLKDEMMKIYNSPDLKPYDTATINQALRLENILNKSIKLGLGGKSADVACSNYSNGDITVFFMDAEDFMDASSISYREDMKSLLEYPSYITDGLNIRYWDGNGFDQSYSGVCKGKL